MIILGTSAGKLELENPRYSTGRPEAEDNVLELPRSASGRHGSQAKE